MFLGVEIMDIILFGVNRNKNIFDNLDYQPLDEIHDLSELLEII